MYIPSTTWTWTFIVTAILQAIIVLALEIYVFIAFQHSLTENQKPTPSVQAISTYLSLFIFGFIYQILLVYDSLRLKNTIQVIGLCIFNLAMLVYAAVQVDQLHKAITTLSIPASDGNQGTFITKPDAVWSQIQPYTTASPCLIGLGTVIMSYVAWKLYDEFAWTIYKHISADLRMKRRFLTFQIYIALLKFDFFFFLGFTVQFLVIVTNITDAEHYCTIAAIPVTILILLLAGFWTRRENVAGMIIVILFYIGGLAYFIFKLFRMYQPSHAQQYLPVQKSLTIFAVLTIVLIVLTITNACMCMSNFNKGLKPFVLKRKIGQDEEKPEGMTELPDLKTGAGAPAPHRMEID